MRYINKKTGDIINKETYDMLYKVGQNNFTAIKEETIVEHFKN